MIYCDVKGFTAFIDRFQSEAEYLHLTQCFQTLRNRLLRPGQYGDGIMLANRIGDACLLFCFCVDYRRLFRYLTIELQRLFDDFCAMLAEFPHPAPCALPTHLKVSVIGGGCPFYETEAVPEDLGSGQPLARSDFFSSTINKLARMDALAEADDFTFLCNGWLRDEFVRVGALNAAAFVDLGYRRLRGFRDAEPIWGFAPKTAGYRQPGADGSE